LLEKSVKMDKKLSFNTTGFLHKTNTLKRKIPISKNSDEDKDLQPKKEIKPIKLESLFHSIRPNKQVSVEPISLLETKQEQVFEEVKVITTKEEESKIPKHYYCINLDRREDRWKEFQNRKPKSIFVERFSAIDGKNLLKYNLDEIEKRVPLKENGSRFGNGVVGCFLSHYRLWKSIASNDKIKENDIIVIFEDDCHFVENWEEQFQSRITEIKDHDWDFCYIGGRFWPNFRPSQEALKKHFKKVTERVYQFVDLELNPNLHRTTHAYAIKKKGAIKGIKEIQNLLLNHVKRFGPIDEFLNDRHTDPFVGYDLVPHLCWSPMDYLTDVQGF